MMRAWAVAAVVAAALTATPALAIDWGREARWLCGEVEGEAPSPARIAAVLARHRGELERGWRRWRAGFGDGLTAWAAKNLVFDAGDIVLYPFSGPDFVTIHRLYPRASRYVMIAGQDAGKPPELSKRAAGPLSEYLAAVRLEFNRFSWNGYFRTSELNEAETDDKGLRGIAPVLLLFARGEGYEVVDVYPIRIDAAGTDLERAPDGEPWRSLRVELKRRDDGARVILDYCSFGLADPQVRARNGMKTWLYALPPPRTVLKAASHLLQTEVFTVVAKALIERSKSIVQDESGLDYLALTKAFDVRLFGRFGVAERSFSELKLEALEKAYKTGRAKVERMTARFGYQKGGGACVQLAWQRKQR